MNATLTLPRRRPLSALFDEMFGEFDTPQQRERRGSLPAMNVAETNEAFRLSFEFPGVAREDVSVEVDGDQLVVSAERKFESEKQEGESFHRVEHRYGKFARSVTLPADVDAERIDASFKNGVLTVTLPKCAPSEMKKIEIRGE